MNEKQVCYAVLRRCLFNNSHSYISKHFRDDLFKRSRQGVVGKCFCWTLNDIPWTWATMSGLFSPGLFTEAISIQITTQTTMAFRVPHLHQPQERSRSQRHYIISLQPIKAGLTDCHWSLPTNTTAVVTGHCPPSSSEQQHHRSVPVWLCQLLLKWVNL